MKARHLLLVALMTTSLAHGKPVTFTVDKQALWIRDGILDDTAIDGLVALFKAHTDIETVHLSDVDGGPPLYARLVLHAALAFRQVEVHGRCGTACAHLSLNSYAPVLHAGASVTLSDESSLFDIGPRATLRRENVEWLQGRLPGIPPAAIERAMLTRGPHDYSLMLRPQANETIVVSLCHPAPDRCERVGRIAPGASRFVVSP